MDVSKLKEVISYYEQKKPYDKEVERIESERSSHIRDLNAIYDSIISEKQKEAVTICGDAPECCHDITFVFPTVIPGGTPIHTHVEKCIACNSRVYANSSKHRIYYKGDKASINDVEADEIIAQMRSVLSQITNFEDMATVLETLNSIMGEVVNNSR